MRQRQEVQAVSRQARLTGTSDHGRQLPLDRSCSTSSGCRRDAWLRGSEYSQAEP
nr:hypothetical protein [Trinickia dabaoshanensis]